MLGRTHELAALGAVTSAAILFPINNLNVETISTSLLVAMLGGLTPDLDKPGSSVWDKVPAGGILSRIIHPIFIGGHRHLTHSLLGLFLFGLGVKALLGVIPLGDIDKTIVFWSFVIAFSSHLVTDMLTKEGVPLLFPLPFHIGFPPFEFLRLRTNGLVENLIVTPAIIIGVIALAYMYKDNTMVFLRVIGIK